MEPAIPPHSSAAASLASTAIFAAMADDLVNQGWTVQDDWFRFQPDLVTSLRDEVLVLDQSRQMQVAGVGRDVSRQINAGIRRDRIAWLTGATPAQAGFFAEMEALRRHLNQSLYLGLRRFEAHFATYQPGDFYQRHRDSFHGRASRVVSLVLYLNPAWTEADGGTLQIYDGKDESRLLQSVLPVAGRAVCFLSEDIPHEVLAGLRTRYSIACWFRQDLPLQGL